MSRAAIGIRQSAFGTTGLRPAGFGNVIRIDFRHSGHSGYLPRAEGRMLNALLCAISCIVTPRQTSVTTLPLVESGLIIVGKATGRWAKVAASRGFARDAHCSFEGGTCIQ